MAKLSPGGPSNGTGSQAVCSGVLLLGGDGGLQMLQGVLTTMLLEHFEAEVDYVQHRRAGNLPGDPLEECFQGVHARRIIGQRLGTDELTIQIGGDRRQAHSRR